MRRYGNGICATASVLGSKVRMLTTRYRGKGRPRTSDYDHMTMADIIEELANVRNQQIDNVMRRACKANQVYPCKSRRDGHHHN